MKLTHMHQPRGTGQVDSSNSARLLRHRHDRYQASTIITNDGADGSSGVHGSSPWSGRRHHHTATCSRNGRGRRSSGSRTRKSTISGACRNRPSNTPRNPHAHTRANRRAPHVSETLPERSYKPPHRAVEINRPAKRPQYIRKLTPRKRRHTPLRGVNAVRDRSHIGVAPQADQSVALYSRRQRSLVEKRQQRPPSESTSRNGCSKLFDEDQTRYGENLRHSRGGTIREYQSGPSHVTPLEVQIPITIA
jgi:hypothetical protein